MHKRELLLGFGAGMIVAAAVTGWFHAQQAPAAAGALSSEQIKDAANAMQMVVLTQEEYEQWQQEKKVNVKPAPQPPKAPSTPAAGQTVQPQAPAAQQATAPQAPAVDSQAKVPQPPGQQAAAATPASVHVPAAPVAATPQPQKQVSFSVPYKATAEGVARQLVEAGILPADNTFVDELRKQDKLNRIRVGTYQIMTPTTEAQIIKLMTTPPKK